MASSRAAGGGFSCKVDVTKGSSKSFGKLVVSVQFPPKTGNRQSDDLVAEQGLLLQQAMEDMVNSPALRAPVYKLIHDQKACLQQVSHIDGAAVKLNDASTLNATDEDFKIAWLVKKSDMTETDVIMIAKTDSSQMNELVQFALQLPFRQPLPAELAVVPVMHAFWDERSGEMGSRLAAFKKNGGVQNGGRVVFQKKTAVTHWGSVRLRSACAVSHTLVAWSAKLMQRSSKLPLPTSCGTIMMTSLQPWCSSHCPRSRCARSSIGDSGRGLGRTSAIMVCRS